MTIDTNEDEYRGQCQHCLLVMDIMYCFLCEESLCMDCLDMHEEECSKFHNEDFDEYELLDYLRIINE